MNKTPYKNTMEWFKSLSGIEDPEDCLRLIMPSIISLQARVKTSSDAVDDIPALSYAAACMALYRAALSEELYRYNSLKAGDITLKAAPEEYRKTLYEALTVALGEAKPYLKTGVVFKGIGGGAL